MLYERITKACNGKICTFRTNKEREDIVAFWWKLQTYRCQFLNQRGRADTAEEVLNDKEISQVRRNWEDAEMYWDLKPEQWKKHWPSIYNAALHNRSGWATVANAIIKYQLPQIPHLRKSDGVTEHIQTINRFCSDLLEWMKIC